MINSPQPSPKFTDKEKERLDAFDAAMKEREERRDVLKKEFDGLKQDCLKSRNEEDYRRGNISKLKVDEKDLESRIASLRENVVVEERHLESIKKEVDSVSEKQSLKAIELNERELAVESKEKEVEKSLKEVSRELGKIEVEKNTVLEAKNALIEAIKKVTW